MTCVKFLGVWRPELITPRIGVLHDLSPKIKAIHACSQVLMAPMRISKTHSLSASNTTPFLNPTLIPVRGSTDGLDGIVPVLVVAADTQAAIGIGHVETDPVCLAIRAVQAVHPEDPLLLSGFAFSQPVDVGFGQINAFALGAREGQC